MNSRTTQLLKLSFMPALGHHPAALIAQHASRPSNKRATSQTVAVADPLYPSAFYHLFHHCVASGSLMGLSVPVFRGASQQQP